MTKIFYFHSFSLNQNVYFFLFKGDFKFDKIGSSYNASVPVFAMRSVPALTGSLLIPLVYMIMLQLNYSQWTAALAGFLFLFGKNPIITQTDISRNNRHILALNKFQIMPCWRNLTTCSWSPSYFSSPWVAFFVFWSSALSNAVVTPKLTLTLYVGGAGSYLALSFWLALCGKID